MDTTIEREELPAPSAAVCVSDIIANHESMYLQRYMKPDKCK